MPSPVTEICYLTLKPDADVNTPGSIAGQTWNDIVTTVSLQAGYQGSHWGTQIENPNVLMMMIDWDARESHFKFMNSPEYGPFLEQISTLTAAPPHFHHITTKPFQPTILSSAPVIEFATFYNIEPGFLSNVEKFVKVVEEAKGEGYLGVAYGETMEDVKKHADQRKEDVKEGKAVVLLIGWESKELHMKFRETDTFKENIHLLREKTGGVEMAHVPFTAA